MIYASRIIVRKLKCCPVADKSGQGSHWLLYEIFINFDFENVTRVAFSQSVGNVSINLLYSVRTSKCINKFICCRSILLLSIALTNLHGINLIYPNNIVTYQLM